MIGDVFSVPWLSGLAWKYTNTVWKTTQHSRFWLVNVRATRASYWSHSVLYSGPGHPRMETDLRTCLRRGRSRSQSPVPLAVCLRVPGRGEYCALCSVSPQFHTKYSPGTLWDLKLFKPSLGPLDPAVWLVDVKQPLISALIIPSPLSPLRCLVWSQTSDVTSHTTVITTTFNNFLL